MSRLALEKKEKERKAIEPGDLPGVILSEADRRTDIVYRDQHMNDGVSDDAKWQDYWRWLIVFPS